MSSPQADPHDPIHISAPNPVVVGLRRVLKILASLRLTVVLLALAIGLVFLGTLAQKTAGMWTVVDKYFWSWIVMIDLQPTLEFFKIFFGLPKDATASSWAQLPFPGGKLLGTLMFANLLAAHATRFKLTWKRAGIWMAHGGLLLLFVGEFITREFQVEQQMSIAEGEASNFAIDSRNFEIAFIKSEGEFNQVTVVSAARFRRAMDRNEIILHPNLPVNLEPLRYMPNAALVEPGSAGVAEENLATIQSGLHAIAVQQPEVSGVDGSDKRDLPALYVRFLDKETGKPVGTYLLSLALKDQTLTVGDTKYVVSLRNIHYYKPFSLRLNHFTYEEYTGTGMAKNYASELTLIDPERGQQRDVVVSMNNPLYYRGEAYYQHQFNQTPAGRMTVLQVVRNPGWFLPYVACSLVGLGLLFHFVLGLTQYLTRMKGNTAATASPVEGWLLTLAGCTILALLVRFGLLAHWLDGFLGPVGSGNLLAEIGAYLVMTAVPLALGFCLLTHRRRAAPTAIDPEQQRNVFEQYLPLAAVTLGVLMLVGAAMPKTYPTSMDLGAMARLPVVDGGRVKPLDTVARVSLRKISAREEFVGTDGKMHPAIEWLMDAMASPTPTGPAWQHKVVRIENDQVLSLLGLSRREGFRYSLEEIAPKFADLQDAAQRANDEINHREGKAKEKADARIEKFFESEDRDVFAKQVLEAYERVNLYTKLCSRTSPLTLPPVDGRDWRSLGGVLRTAQRESFFMVVESQGMTELLPPRFRGLSAEERAMLPAELVDELMQFVMGRLGKEEADAVNGTVRQLTVSLIKSDPSATQFGELLAAYRVADSAEFAKALSEFQQATEGRVSSTDQAKAQFEVFLNEFAPTYYIIYLYVFAGLFGLCSWVVLGFRRQLAEAFEKSAFWLLVVAFVIHGFALFSRMYLMDRPLVFVTNLYSTAVFIGWAAVGVGLLIERVIPIGLGNMAAAVVGGATAILAHNLAAGSDTLEQLVAVLDTNFWLATHVTTINLGYAATYVAGVMGVIYILLGLFTPALGKPGSVIVPTVGGLLQVRGPHLGRLLGQVMYGVICLATLLSFVGTVLGGIWADYSWGRFWGWDPKENGAVLIVLWNALILHARWCGLVKDRGIAVLTLVGNMITTWSYFGTNQLGVGLHNYGFNNALATGCMITWMLHLGLIGVGLTPLKYWRSFAGGSQSASASTERPASAHASNTAAPSPAAGHKPPVNGQPSSGHAKPGKGKRHGRKK